MPKAKATRGSPARPPTHVLQLRVSLRYIKPPIWRRVWVPDNWRLGDLHPLLVSVMGWGGYHLHTFRFGGGFAPTEYSTRQMVLELGPQILDEDQVLLSDVIRRSRQTFSYEYDYGDCWQHEVKVEKILPCGPGVSLPVCLAGERACPPEDCGGVPGYENVLRVLRKAKTPEDLRLREWIGCYDPENFDLEVVNLRLRPRSAR